MEDDYVHCIELDTRIIKSARIEHKCTNCSDPITVGERYFRSALLVDGEFYVEKYHARFCGED